MLLTLASCAPVSRGGQRPTATPPHAEVTQGRATTSPADGNEKGEASADAPGTNDGPGAGPAAAAAATPTSRPAGASPIRIETEVTYIASLIHFVDSLAGSSGGKTIPVYRRLWIDRFDEPTDLDKQAVHDFLAVRASSHARAIALTLPPEGSLSPDWSSRFLYLALEARGFDDFNQATEPFLSDRERTMLRSSIEHFRPGFDEFWQRGDFLQRFDLRFRRFLDAGALTGYLDEVARFFQVDPGSYPSPVLSFVLLPEAGSTHAQALGRRLLIEIRPNDTPEAQVQVVTHEGSHYLFELIPGARRAALETRAHAAGEAGVEAWRLLHEALPTALGQGLAAYRLTPNDFRIEGTWYHIKAIDRFAKRIFPIVRREIDARRTIDGAFIDEVIEEYKKMGEAP